MIVQVIVVLNRTVDGMVRLRRETWMTEAIGETRITRVMR